MSLIEDQIAAELGIEALQVRATMALLDEGATVPFIARYRKEATRGLDDSQLRTLQTRLAYLTELDLRRQAIINTLREQGNLSSILENALLAAPSKTRLEDLYMPFKPKRRTKGQIAKEAGLQPLAEALLENPSLVPETLAEEYWSEQYAITSSKQALEGARFILMEQFADDANLVGQLREYVKQHSHVFSKKTNKLQKIAAKFSDYFDYNEVLTKIPSHRALALLRGRKAGVLQLHLDIGNSQANHPCPGMIAKHFAIAHQGRPADDWLLEVCAWTWKAKLHPRIELDLMGELRNLAELEAIKVFASNLKDLLMAPPAGAKVTIGLDPGIRTGVKVVVIDATGKLLDHCVIYPHPPKKQWDESIASLAQLADKYHAQLICVGNGTASRETDRLLKDLMSQHAKLDLVKVLVSEAGASVYSASALAAKEFPDLDVSIRGAVSIARRLQDPLAELVKIDAKSIGVGQYQHDLNQSHLARSLESVVEDCTNAVGVEVNTASAPLLERVSGLSGTLAHNIVAYRESHGAFNNRESLKKVKRMGEKAFEQAAGFLRIPHGDNPLDSSGVHPEAYSVVQKILDANKATLNDLIANNKMLNTLQAKDFVDEQFGLPTVLDIIEELKKPGRDPRPEFKTVNFKEGVEAIADLKAEMVLEGVVTNVTNFGAFVDVGVHQDGLVHISALANKFVKDPREVVKAGDFIKVKVLEVDIERKRIALTCRLHNNEKGHGKPKNEQNRAEGKKNLPKRNQQQLKKPSSNKQKNNNTNAAEPPRIGTLGDLLASALKGK